MLIDVYSQPERLPENQLANSTVIVIDVLRASTSVIWALKNGADKIIPAKDPGEAAEMTTRLGRAECVLAGERDSAKLSGFNLGNSPEEFIPAVVKAKTVILSTTNGTAAMYSVRNAKRIFIGAMINRTAVAMQALSQNDNIIIMCAGSQGQLSADDLCAAGAIIEVLQTQAPERIPMNDLAVVCLALYRDFMEGRFDLSQTAHFAKLTEMGLGQDTEFCFKADITDVVPVYQNGIIVYSA